MARLFSTATRLPGCGVMVCWLAGAPVAHATLPATELLLPQWSGGLVANAELMPSAAAAAALEPFQGTLVLSEAAMVIKPRPLHSGLVLGRDPAVFPRIELSFATDSGDLVPLTQDVIRAGSVGVGRSFWDVIVQPGRVWSEPGDAGWSRAVFPFALVNSLEGETHNGMAIFLYRSGRVSNLRLQIVQQTAPFYVKEQFFAAALVPAHLQALTGDPTSALATYRTARTDAVPIAPWSELAAAVGAGRLAGFDGKMPPSDIVLAGLDYHGTFYLEGCFSAAGPMPLCERARFGVWSATKALANETALLRLAQKYGAAVFDLKVADYIPQLAGQPGWRDVRFEDAINMATGIGNGTAVTQPNNISDGYLEGNYARWYEARTVQEKLQAVLETGHVHPWGPGKVARYRDQDMFVLGVAMNQFLKSKAGPASDLWDMLQTEVFTPIGIHYAPTNRTLEPDGSRGQPLMAYGYYPSIGDLVRIARLYHEHGRHGETQILYAPRVAAVLPGSDPWGLPTGERLRYGETTYGNAFWIAPYHANGGCQIYYPRMLGWGGNLIALLPQGITGIRLAKSAETRSHVEVDTAGMAEVADRLAPMCP